ncbi:MAG: hypothetical protein M3264_08955 [Thermoproteota archaeon]|nr:hypothetical protein [Thermoproteota archaeon]
MSEYSKQMQYNKTTSILIAVQTWRIVGIAFLWGMTLGIVEPAFAIPAGVGDVLIGITAIPFAIFLWKGYSWSKYAVVVWSVLGIADLVNAITLGAIINPVFSTSIFSTFPWILFPTVAVPLGVALHGVILYRLRNWVPIQAHRNTLEA